MAWRAHADIVDLGSCYEIRMILHGLHPEHLVVEVRDEVLVIRGRHDAVAGAASDFQRLVSLPADAARMGVTARLDSDRLVVRLPRDDARKPTGTSVAVETRTAGTG